MKRKKIAGVVLTTLLISVFRLLSPGQAFCGGYFLVDGIGLEGKLEIGRSAPKEVRSADAQGWSSMDGMPLDFKTTGDNRVAVIRCASHCLTNRGIAIGSSVKEVLLTYSTPDEEKVVNDGKKVLIYKGVGFLLDQKESFVEGIYIFPSGIQTKK